jgi:hypothetical protein
MQIVIILLITLSISLLSFILFSILLHKYTSEPNKRYRIHALTKLLIALTFFLFIDGIYYSLLFATQYRLIWPNLFFILTEPQFQIIPKLGIFISAVFVVQFIMEKHIEEFKNKEDNLVLLEKLNHELEKKAAGMESAQEHLQKKVIELEKFNDIAKTREQKMVDLIEKIEVLETRLKKKK